MDAVDVAIVGGGLVGASLAAALARGHLKIALLESASPPAGEASWDERCIALNAGSRSIFESIGVWDALERFAEPIVWTHISERGKFGVARFTAAEAGLPALGYNVPVRALGQVLWQRLEHADGVELISPARVREVRGETDRVVLGIEGPARRIDAKLVVAADGAQSAVRTLLGVEARTRDYEQRAIVTAVRTTRAHRGCAYERFTPDGPIALLPKPEGACSLVWTVPADRADEMLGWDEEQFLRAAQAAFGERLGRFTALGHRAAFALSQVLSDQLTAPRVIFAGNAAQSLHPVAAQGFNLGLRDVATIAELVADAADPGAAELLAEYERRRSRDRELVSGFTDRLVRLFSNRVPALRGLRHLGLLALDVLPPVKEAVMYQNLGFGSLPARLQRDS
jgi:2-octaprenyl-6-methoxyphenol hydroxylase